MLIKAIEFWGKESVSDAEYKLCLKKQQRAWSAAIVLGVMTLLFELLLGNTLINLFGDGTGNARQDFQSGLYFGIGVGLVTAGVVMAVRTRRVMRNDALRKQMRLSALDERNQMIALKSLNAAGIIVFVIAYLGIMISGLINTAVFYTLMAIIILYCMSFIIAKVFYSRKM